jgi:hypothetical protein
VRLPLPEIPILAGSPKGNDLAAVYPNGLLTLDYWDLWCLLAAKQRFRSQLSSLRDSLIAIRRGERAFFGGRREDVEDLISLIYDLEQRIKGIGSVDDILSGIPEKLIKKESQKAIRNIMESRGYYPPSQAMLRSPRRLLFTEAMRGMWSRLPFDPSAIAENLRPLFIPKKSPGYFPKGTTFALGRRVEKAIDKELYKANESVGINRRGYHYAVYRAALTLFHEQNHWDDSYGTMGELGQAWVSEILGTTADDIGVEFEVFLKDALMFFCWENYGLSDSKQICEFVNKLDVEQRTIAARMLTDIRNRSQEGFQEFRAETAQLFLNGIVFPRATPIVTLVPSPPIEIREG